MTNSSEINRVTERDMIALRKLRELDEERGRYAMPRHDMHRKALREAMRVLPLTEVCELVAVHISERPDLELKPLQKLQKELMDVAWPLIKTEDL